MAEKGRREQRQGEDMAAGVVGLGGRGRGAIDREMVMVEGYDVKEGEAGAGCWDETAGGLGAEDGEGEGKTE